MNKCKSSLKQAIKESGLKDGMTVSFHHHLRNGDCVLNTVMDCIAEMGIRNIKVNASSLTDVALPLLDHIKNGVVTGIETAYIGPALGRELTKGILPEPIIFRSHGARAHSVSSGISHIDVAFIAASMADKSGNLTGQLGRSAFGPMGYAIADARSAGYKIALTDCLVEKNDRISINGELIDAVVCVESIGDPEKIMSNTTEITRSPLRLKIAKDTARLIAASGLLTDGMSFQTGSGGISLAAAKFLRDEMKERGVVGSYCLGGITKYLVDLYREGLFSSILDVQCFDMAAVNSLRDDEEHREISCTEYADIAFDGCYINNLNVAILSATEIDLDFNVNVHTDSYGNIMGGSGGHTDASEGADLTVIVAPLLRGRISTVKKRVTTVSTPGKFIDVFVSERGIAVNPLRSDLYEKFKEAGLPLMDIKEQYARAVELTGVPDTLKKSEKIAAKVLFRDGSLLDTISVVE